MRTFHLNVNFDDRSLFIHFFHFAAKAGKRAIHDSNDLTFAKAIGSHATSSFLQGPRGPSPPKFKLRHYQNFIFAR